VAIRYVYRSLPEFQSLLRRYRDAPADHPNIAFAAELVRTWPLAFAQCQRLVDTIHPALDVRIALESNQVYRGASSHSIERLFGTLWATIYCPIGLAEAIVHEMAHQKLRVLGVSFESANALVANDRRSLYVSPVVKGRLRPMTAVLHAQYSYVYVTNLDIHILQTECDGARQDVIRRRLHVNLSRITEGYDTIRTHFEPGEHGREFMEGFASWTQKTIDLARTMSPA
jgi:HEXXH motif-containing protein